MIGPVDGRLDAHQSHPAARRRRHGGPELGREPRKLRHDRAAEPFAGLEAEDLFRRGIGVQQPAVGVHGEHARADVAQHVVRLELDLAHFGGERLARRAQDVDPARNVGNHERDEHEHPELNPDARRHGSGMAPEHVREIDEPRENRHDLFFFDGDEDDVEAGEIRVGAARHVDGGGDQKDIEQRLEVQEGRPGYAAAEMRMPVRHERNGGRSDEHERGDEDVEWCGDLDFQRAGDINGDRQAHPAQVDQPEELERGRDRPLRFDAQPAHGGALLAVVPQNARATGGWRLGGWAVGRLERKTAPNSRAVSNRLTA